MSGMYRPFAATNSVYEAAVVLVFRRGFDAEPVELARGRVEDDWSKDFSRFQAIHGGEINIDLSDPSSPSQLPTVSRLTGFQFSSTPSEHKPPSRVLRLSDNTLMVSFSEYPGWKNALAASMNYVKTALTVLPLVNNAVVAFALRYIDRYIFDGPNDQCRADLLFRRDCGHLAPHVFDAGPYWHCHTGWFETQTKARRVLNQLNVASSVVDGHSTVTIDHKATNQLADSCQSIESLLAIHEPSPGLESTLDLLHERNKELIAAALREDMLDAIGIEP